MINRNVQYRVQMNLKRVIFASLKNARISLIMITSYYSNLWGNLNEDVSKLTTSQKEFKLETIKNIVNAVIL